MGQSLNKKEMQKKDLGVKTKPLTFTFTISNENHMSFLNAILNKYGLDRKYRAMSKHFFPVKIHVPLKK